MEAQRVRISITLSIPFRRPTYIHCSIPQRSCVTSLGSTVATRLQWRHKVPLLDTLPLQEILLFLLLFHQMSPRTTFSVELLRRRRPDK